MPPSNKRHLAQGIAFIENIQVTVTVYENFSGQNQEINSTKISSFKVLYFILM